MAVRAKFKVTSITRQPGWGNSPKEVQSIKLHPVSGNSEENMQFFAATPTGSIELGCANLEAVKEFDLNDEFYVTFEKAPKAES